jgi:hypothetical protein
MRARFILFLAISLTTGACASGPGSRAQRGSANLISSEQLRDASTVSNTLDEVIQRLRPLWLRERVSSVTGGRILPLVYVNGTRYGEIDLLRSISAHEVERVEYLPPSDATTLYGTGHAGGVISVATRR